MFSCSPAFGSELSCEIRVLQTIEQKAMSATPPSGNKDKEGGVSLDLKNGSEIKFELFSVTLKDASVGGSFLLGIGSRESPATRFDGYVGYGQENKTPKDYVIEKSTRRNGIYYVCYQAAAGLAITHECAYADGELKIVASWIQDIHQSPLRMQNVNVVLGVNELRKWKTR